MKKLIYVLTISVLCVSGCLSEKSSYQANYNFGGIDKIAIVAVDGEVQNSNAKNQIANLFVMELLNKGYAPIPLAQVIAKVQALVDSGDISEPPQEDAHVQVGQILKVPAVLVINVPYFDQEISITAQLINTDDGSVLWMNQDYGQIGYKSSEAFRNSGNGKNKDDYLMDPLLMFQGPPEEPQNQQMSIRPGDRSLKIDELQKIETIVSKICSTLPSAVTKRAEHTGSSPVIRTKPKTTGDW